MRHLPPNSLDGVSDGDTAGVTDGNELVVLTKGEADAWIAASLNSRNVSANTENNR